MIDAENLISTICLIVVFIACVIHLTTNINWHSNECERWGFVLTGAGAIGRAVYFWSTRFEEFPFPALMHLGMALIALSLIYGRVRGWVAQLPGMRWTERRQRTP